MEQQKGHRYDIDKFFWDPRKCVVCGKMYYPNQHNQKYCSPECKRVNDRKRSKQYYHDHKERCKENAKRWRRENPERAKLIKNRFRERHKEDIKRQNLERNRRWRDKNPEKYVEQYTRSNKRKPILKCSKAHGNCYECFTEDGECVFE